MNSPAEIRAEPDAGPPSLVRRLVTVGAIVLLLGVLGLVLALNGGLAAAPPEQPPVKKPGQMVATGRMEITPIRAWLATKDPTDASEYATAGRFLAVELEMKLTDGESVNDQHEIAKGFRVKLLPSGQVADPNGRGAKAQVSSALAADRSMGQLQPGLPARIVVAYEFSPSQRPPASIELGVYDWRYEPGFTDARDRWWTGDTVLARYPMQVRGGAS